MKFNHNHYEFLYEPDVDWPDNDDGYSEPRRMTFEDLVVHLGEPAHCLPARYLHYRGKGESQWLEFSTFETMLIEQLAKKAKDLRNVEERYETIDKCLSAIIANDAPKRHPFKGVQDDYDELLNTVIEHAPESWDDDVAIEAIVIEYVKHLEHEVDRLSGSRERPTQGNFTDGFTYPEEKPEPPYPTPCGACGTTYTECTNRIQSGEGRACCGRCANTATHNQAAWERVHGWLTLDDPVTGKRSYEQPE